MALYQQIIVLFTFPLIINCLSTKPNIIFVLVDDWGYADVGVRNPAILSPNFDQLMKTGVMLDRHYVFKYCSPSRASLLTGRWPHHVHQWNPPIDATVGLNINMTLLPAKLKQAGYQTHMVGKWHEGLMTPAYLPVNRGFDTSSGFLGGGEDHMTQTVGCAVDFWKSSSPDKRNGTYDAYLYRKDLMSVFAQIDPNDPLFLYLPLHNVHAPFEAPDEWVNKYDANSTCTQRRIYQAMVSVADNVTELVVQLLKEKNMWDNTIMIVSADNGGAPCGGSNYPLKGSKGTFFEGGVRSLAFANGGLIPDKMRGKSTQGFIHIADWYPTFCKLAGVDPTDSGEGKFPVDGMDVWPLIIGETTGTGNKEIVLGFNFTYTKNRQDEGAILVGENKLIIGSQYSQCDNLMWSPLDYPCSQGEVGDDCDPYCVYNVVKDPEERHNLAKEQPNLLKSLLDRYSVYSKEPRYMQDQGYSVGGGLPVFEDACAYMKEHGGYWQPWREK